MVEGHNLCYYNSSQASDSKGCRTCTVSLWDLRVVIYKLPLKSIPKVGNLGPVGKPILCNCITHDCEVREIGSNKCLKVCLGPWVHSELSTTSFE